MAEVFGLDPIELENIITQSEFEELPNVVQPLHPSALVRERFEDLNQEEIQAFIRNQENENTKKKLKATCICSSNTVVRNQNIEI